MVNLLTLVVVALSISIASISAAPAQSECATKLMNCIKKKSPSKCEEPANNSEAVWLTVLCFLQPEIAEAQRQFEESVNKTLDPIMACLGIKERRKRNTALDYATCTVKAMEGPMDCLDDVLECPEIVNCPNINYDDLPSNINLMKEKTSKFGNLWKECVKE